MISCSILKLSVTRNIFIKRFIGENKKFNSNLKLSYLMSKMKKKKPKVDENINKLTPSSIKFIVIGNGGIGCPKALYVYTDEVSYLFNCSESTSRLANILDIRPFKPKHVFITQNKWENIGGLIGLGMNLETSGKDSIMVHAPPNLEEFFYSSRLFGISAGIKIIYNSFTETFKDYCFKIDKISLKPSQKYKNPFKKVRLNFTDEVFCYHLKINDRIGRLDLNKCIELKIPVGPLLSKIKNGENIKLDDGRIITQADVCGKPFNGSDVLIIDCPAISYLDSLIENETLNDLINDKKSRLKHVVHFSDIDVVLEKNYQDWINKFPSNVEHLGLNQFCSTLSFLSPHRQKFFFNKFDFELFPKLYYEEESQKLSFESRLKLAKPTDSFDLGQKKINLILPEIRIDEEALNSELSLISNIDEALKKYKTDTESMSNKEIIYPEIVFLGTASAAPGKYRNSSGILINLSENESCILDCGEGTLYELIRFYGKNKYLEKLYNLKFIFASHLHADHHLGLIYLLLEREKCSSQLNKKPEPLELFIPNSVYDFLKIYDQGFQNLNHLYNFNQTSFSGDLVINEDLVKKLNLKSMVLTKVRHCYQSNGISFSFINNKNKVFKLTYSGDALPSNSLVKIGKDSDLLIHEGTFPSLYEEDALMKKHSTCEQAIELRDEMNAKFLILTHFSQRYSKMVSISNKFDNRVGIAFDSMIVNSNNLYKLPQFTELLKTFYKAELLDLELKYQKRKKTNDYLENLS